MLMLIMMMRLLLSLMLLYCAGFVNAARFFAAVDAADAVESTLIVGESKRWPQQ